MSTSAAAAAPPGQTVTQSLTERKAQLTPLEYRVTQEKATERPFSNRYNRHWERGSYHCVLCNIELFKSESKFESKSGWPAFDNVIDEGRVRLKPDLSHVGANLLLLISRPDLARTEVSCSNCNAHLGHLFKDGPKPTGLRYCINSSSLIFAPADEPPPQPLTKSKSNQDIKSSSANTNAKAVESKSSSATTTPIRVVPAKMSCGGSGGDQSSGKICFFTTKSKPSSTSNSNSNTKTAWLSQAARGGGDVSRKISAFQNGHVTEVVSRRPSSGGILRETSL